MIEIKIRVKLNSDKTIDDENIPLTAFQFNYHTYGDQKLSMKNTIILKLSK